MCHYRLSAWTRVWQCHECVSKGVNVRVLCAAVTIGAKEREIKTESVRIFNVFKTKER